MEQSPNILTEKKSSPVRCINLDWLEVHCREATDHPRDSIYYMNQGWRVDVRPYGTRVYRQMFTLVAMNEEPILEIRREPASQGLKGIHEFNECHIRLCNRTCYFDNAAAFLKTFLDNNGYYDVRISRVDICLDFVQFDKGDLPQAFVRRYFHRKYSKINQGNISGHGVDTWNGQEWNSLSWGSLSSPVTTKLYNKTLELYDAKLDKYKKPYIREAWFKCGFIDDIQRVTKEGVQVEIWRVEFSLRSAVKNWVRLELDGVAKKYQSIRNTLDCYDSREKLLVIFASLANHYFRFKKFIKDQRKDRCPDKVLFDFSAKQRVYKVGRNDTALGSGQTFKAVYNRLLEKLKAYQMSHWGADIQKACEVLINSITEENLRSDLANPWDRDELELLKTMLHVRSRDKSLTYDAALSEVKKLLNITNRTISQF